MDDDMVRTLVIVLASIGVVAFFMILQLALMRWAARRFADRLSPGWPQVAAEFSLEPLAGRLPLGVALRYEGQIDGHRAHVIAYRRWFSKMTMGWRASRVIVIEVNARWRCAPKRKKGVVWSVDSLGYQGSPTLWWHGEALPKDAPEVAPGVAASTARDLEPADQAVLERRVATAQAWVLPDRVSLAWTGDTDDEGATLAAALADARALARLAGGSPSR